MGKISGRITLILGAPLIFLVFMLACTLASIYHDTLQFGVILKRAWREM